MQYFYNQVTCKKAAFLQKYIFVKKQYFYKIHYTHESANTQNVSNQYIFFHEPEICFTFITQSKLIGS